MTYLVRSVPGIVRTLSTLVGRSGRIYQRTKVLQTHPKDSNLNICLAICGQQQFVLKPVSKSIFEFSQELRDEFGSERRLRTHVDENESQQILIYEYFMGDLFTLISRNADIPLKPRIDILREVGPALKVLHVKPYNVVLNWAMDSSGNFQPERVVLADLDCALRLQDSKLLNTKIGNVMWRSPEGQAARGIGKHSEIFSFGLTCLHTITGVETLHPDFEKLRAEGTDPEHLIFYKLLSMFGPVPPQLISYVADDEFWREYATQLVEVIAEEDPECRFEHWNERTFPNLNNEVKRLILRMTNLDPTKRATIDRIMDDRFWK